LKAAAYTMPSHRQQYFPLPCFLATHFTFPPTTSSPVALAQGIVTTPNGVSSNGLVQDLILAFSTFTAMETLTLSPRILCTFEVKHGVYYRLGLFTESTFWVRFPPFSISTMT
jgi:hypothetical protein